jgi:hypothetical protein
MLLLFLSFLLTTLSLRSFLRTQLGMDEDGNAAALAAAGGGATTGDAAAPAAAAARQFADDEDDLDDIYD